MFLLGLGAGTMWKGMDLDEHQRQARTLADGLNQKIEALERSVEDLSKERDQAQGLLSQKEQQAGDLERRLSDAEARLAAAIKQKSEQVAAKAAEPKPVKAMAQMMKSPEMREVMKQQHVAQMDMVYGGLFKRFSLNESEKEELKKMIAEKEMAESEFAFKAMGEDASPKDMQASAQALKNTKEAADLKIKAFLNNDQDFATYQNWEKTKPERIALSMGGRSAFAGAGEPLTSAQEDQLVNAMMAARTRRTEIPDLTKAENLSTENLSSQSIEKILASYDLQAREVAAAATAFLTPKQLEALKTMQQQQKALQEAGLRMSATMFGGKK